MLAGLANIFGGGPAARSARARLVDLAHRDELQLLYAFAHGNLERAAWVERATCLLGQPWADELELLSLHDEARDPNDGGALSYAALRSALRVAGPGPGPPPAAATERSASPTSHIPGARGGGASDLFAGSKCADPGRVDRQAFRLAMLRIGLHATPTEIDCNFIF